MNCKSPNWCKNIRDSPLDSPVFNPPDSFSSLWFIKHHTPAGVNISVFCADIMRFLRTELQIASKKKKCLPQLWSLATSCEYLWLDQDRFQTLWHERCNLWHLWVDNLRWLAHYKFGLHREMFYWRPITPQLLCARWGYKEVGNKESYTVHLLVWLRPNLTYYACKNAHKLTV